MRRLVAAAIMALVAQNASAADLPILRGSYSERPVVQRPLWEGFYVGGHATTGSTDADFTNANQDLQTRANADLARAGNPVAGLEWPMLRESSAKASGYGGFVGYNMQWDDAIVGVEANYVRSSFNTLSANSLPPQTIAGNGGTYSAISSSRANLRITDMGSLRIRGGWSWNGFLPYAFAGVGLGLADYDRSVGVTSVPTGAAPPPALPDYLLTETKSNRLLYGYSAGLGLDMMLVAGLFARVEWEYTKFGSTQFATTLDPTINTVRAGLGYKF